MLLEANSTHIPADVLEKTYNNGFNKGYVEGTKTMVGLFEKIYGVERRALSWNDGIGE